jgi:2-polyprenyl-6-methoxyphenol hydroxylase-like FAD-dependent oxidoreductase
MMFGYLLARQGVRVTVIEKHKDFFRDFRGDTVHPSTLELFYELGLLDEFLNVPHQKVESAGGIFGDFQFTVADFRHVPAPCKFIALMPQWDFLDFLADRARRLPSFDLRMEHEATGLTIDAGGRVTGVEVKTPSGPTQIAADLVIGCDGRHSITRQAGRLPLLEIGVPIDVLWFRISRQANDPEQVPGNINYGRVLILINRGDYFQAGLIVQKDSFEQLKRTGLDEFRETIRRIAPYLGERVQEIKDWDQVKLLTVQINSLRKWHRPGLLCIGDSAHAMSPAGGVGINLAIQDAVATANLLGGPLRERRVGEEQLASVQRRREFPTRATQLLQIGAHKAFEKIFQNPGSAQAPWRLKAVMQVPGFQRVMGPVVGMGVRPEHIAGAPRSPAFRTARVARSLVGAAGIAFVLLVRQTSRRALAR